MSPSLYLWTENFWILCTFRFVGYCSIARDNSQRVRQIQRAGEKKWRRLAFYKSGCIDLSIINGTILYKASEVNPIVITFIIYDCDAHTHTLLCAYLHFPRSTCLPRMRQICDRPRASTWRGYGGNVGHSKAISWRNLQVLIFGYFFYCLFIATRVRPATCWKQWKR